MPGSSANASKAALTGAWASDQTRGLIASSASCSQSAKRVVAPKCGISYAGRPPPFVKSNLKKKSLGGVESNADQQPVLHKDEDLVLRTRSDDEQDRKPCISKSS